MVFKAYFEKVFRFRNDGLDSEIVFYMFQKLICAVCVRTDEPIDSS